MIPGLFFGAGCTLAFVVILFFAPEVSEHFTYCTPLTRSDKGTSFRRIGRNVSAKSEGVSICKIPDDKG